MTKKDRQRAIDFIHAYMHPISDDEYERKKLKHRDTAIEAMEQIDELGDELRKVRKGIKDEKVLIGFNMAIAICNKHFGENNTNETSGNA